MNDDVMLQMLKCSLNISHNHMDGFLKSRLIAARQEIERSGVGLDVQHPEDCFLIIDYAAWLVRKRDQDVGFPRNLQYRIRSRLASRKKAGEVI